MSRSVNFFGVSVIRLRVGPGIPAPKQSPLTLQQVEEPDKTADVLGISAVMVQDMRGKRISMMPYSFVNMLIFTNVSDNYHFDMDRMTSFEGDTGQVSPTILPLSFTNVKAGPTCNMPTRGSAQSTEKRSPPCRMSPTSTSRLQISRCCKSHTPWISSANLLVGLMSSSTRSRLWNPLQCLHIYSECRML